jgi:AraC-like DNA-binding protein
MLVERLGQSVLTLDAAARALAGASFRLILDDVRSDIARALLQDRSLSIADIAFFLQYSEPAAFHRSFGRWTGLTPHAFREA